MKQENKELLFKDLSARLPYHVRVKVWLKDGTTEEGVLDLEHNYADVLLDAFYYNKIIDIKPYLRPLSSITEEERLEISNLIKHDVLKNPFGKINPKGMDNLLHSVIVSSSSLIKWLLEKHFDFMELIPKDLAIEITKENNPYK